MALKTLDKSDTLIYLVLIYFVDEGFIRIVGAIV